MPSNVDECSLEEAIEKIGFGRFQILVTIVFGLILSGEAIEYFIISYVVPYTNAEWQLSNINSAAISISFFLGLFVGSYVWGYLADRFGRQRCLLLALCVICHYGVLSAASPTYLWFLFLRGIVGFSLSGSFGTVFPLFMEMIPQSRRNLLFALHGVMGGAAGSLFLLCSMKLISAYGWRPLVVLAVTPTLLGIVCALKFIPDSPRFLLLHNQKWKAEQIFNDMASFNKLPDFTCNLKDLSSPRSNAGILSLFTRQQLRLTLPVLYICLASGFIHYNNVLFSVVLPDAHQSRCPTVYLRNHTFDASCVQVHSNYFLPLILGTAGEMLAFLAPGVISSLCGRRSAIFISSTVNLVLFVVHGFCKSELLVAISLFFHRAASLGLLLTIFMYTSEAHPTEVRAIALGTGIAMSRVGNLLAPLMAQVFLPVHPLWQSSTILIVVTLIVMLMVPILPFETKQRHLYDTFTMPESQEQPDERSKLRKWR